MVELIIVTVVVCGVALASWWLNDRSRRRLVPDLTSKAVFVTGTDSGFGRRLALDLSSRGLIVYAGCYTDHGVEGLASARSDIRVLKLDVTDEDSVRRARDFIQNDLPPGQGLWGVVNNAGIPGGYMAEWADLDEHRRVMDVNFFGQVSVIWAMLPLVKQARGRIVNFGSITGRLAMLLPYSASKAAVHAYSDGLRRMLAQDGIRVSLIEPGVYQTEMSSRATTRTNLEAQWTKLSEEKRREYGGQEFLNQLLDQFEKAVGSMPLSSANRLSDVTDSVFHALASVRPKDRYVCGRDARYLYRPIVTLLPDWAIDRVMAVLLH